MSELVRTGITDGIAQVRLNRPEKKNALNRAMFDAIAAAGEALKDAAGLRAVVLSGEGGCFCAGIDTASFMELAGNIEATRAELLNPPKGWAANYVQKPSTVWSELNVPVIAAIEGVAFGGGAQIALGADFRIIAPDARFSIMEARWGLIPDMGISQSLPRLMRADQALELMMTGRICDAAEAHALGLVTRVAADPVAVAMEMARDLALRSPDALAGCKQLAREVWSMPPDAGLRVEAEIQVPIIGAPNQVEKVMSEMQKRAPKFATST